MIAASQAVAPVLVEGLLHDARNPLNALAINLEVLNEKLKDEQGAVDPALEKNLRAMREQVFKADLILRTYAEFLAVGSPAMQSELTLSEVLERALEMLVFEARRRGMKVKADVEKGVAARLDDPGALRFLAYHAVLRALARSEKGGEVQVSLRRAGDQALLRVQDDGGDDEPALPSREAMEALGRARSVEVSVHGGRCELVFKAG
ncbi:MAG TPA: histidine kinase [Myxococcaceae bacterium]|nr:histidine kinase [Myxococcaceae bacterium]